MMPQTDLHRPFVFLSDLTFWAALIGAFIGCAIYTTFVPTTSTAALFAVAVVIALVSGNGWRTSPLPNRI